MLHPANSARTVAIMPSCNIRNVRPITINWPVVDDLMAAAGIANDSALAERGGTNGSTISRARRGAASPSAMTAIATALPDASFDDLFVLPGVEAAA